MYGLRSVPFKTDPLPMGYALTVTAAVAAPVRIPGNMLAARIMAGHADMASSVARFVAMKPIEWPFAALWERTSVSIMRIPAIIDVPVEAVGTVEPRTGANEDASDKPIGPIVAVRSAVVRRIVEVAIGTDRLRSNVHAEGNLSGNCGFGHHQHNGKTRKSKHLPDRHKLLLLRRAREAAACFLIRHPIRPTAAR